MIISISGQPGAGKTTLCAALADALGARVVSYDAFETFTRQDPATISDWLKRGAPYAEIGTPGLARRLAELSAEGTVLFDTPLGRAHPQTGSGIGLAVWIDCPPDLALSRKLSQITRDIPPQQASAYLAWQSTYLDQYASVLRPTYAVQTTRVKPLCDLILNAQDPVRDLVGGMLNRLRTTP